MGLAATGASTGAGRACGVGFAMGVGAADRCGAGAGAGPARTGAADGVGDPGAAERGRVAPSAASSGLGLFAATGAGLITLPGVVAASSNGAARSDARFF
jgi:hypothetical protein